MNMYDMNIKSLDEFKEFTLDQLGGRYNKIELKNGNWKTILIKVIAYFRDYDSGACINRRFLKLELQHGLQEYDLKNFNVTKCIKILGTDSMVGNGFYAQLLANGVGSAGTWLNQGNAHMTSDMMNNLNDFVMNYSNVRTVEKFFQRKFRFTFNKIKGILTLVNPPRNGKAIPVVVDCFMLDDLIDCFNNTLFQSLTHAYTQIQWAKNLEGKVKIEFPHGEILVSDILQEGKDAAEKYELEIKNFKNRALIAKS